MSLFLTIDVRVSTHVCPLVDPLTTLILASFKHVDFVYIKVDRLVGTKRVAIAGDLRNRQVLVDHTAD